YLAATATYTAYLNNRFRYMSLAPERYHGRLLVMDAIDRLLIEFPEMGLSTYVLLSVRSGVAFSGPPLPVINLLPPVRFGTFSMDMFIIDWLEKVGGDYDVITEEDLHREGLALLKPYRVVITGSHPEYDSIEMLDALEVYVRGGGRLMYLGGNGFYWRIAPHPTKPGRI